MKSQTLKTLWLLWRWLMAAVAVYVMWELAWHAGKEAGENGLGYWQGWTDCVVYYQTSGELKR